MGIEAFSFISSLNAANPVGATDPKSQGDDHIRGIKATLVATFPNLNAAVNFTPAEANFLVGVTSAIQTQLDAKASAAHTHSVLSSLQLSSAAPIFRQTATGAAANEGTWAWIANADGSYQLQSQDDGLGGGDPIVGAGPRVGTAPSYVFLGTTTVPTAISGSTIEFLGNGTTAVAANAVLSAAAGPFGGDLLLRSTSSSKYKRDIRDVFVWELDGLAALRPVAYRSAIAADGEREFYGLIAEDVALVNERLVHFLNGAPDGVMYDRLTVLLIGAVQRLEKRVDELEARVDALESQQSS